MNNFDMQKVMAMLSQMDKKDLEQGLAKASEILKNKEMEENMRKNCNSNSSNSNNCNSNYSNNYYNNNKGRR